MPARIIACAVTGVVKMMLTCPAIMSVIAGAAPLYGTCRMSVPESILKYSSARWLLPPAPEDPPVSWPGFAFAIAISSFMLAAGNVALVSNMIGDQPSSVTEAKSSGR